MNTHHDEERQSPTGFILTSLVVGLAAMVGVMALGALPSTPAARVGDIIAFNRPVYTQDLARIEATRLDRTGGVCVLDPTIMGHAGGSLVIESRLPGKPARFVVDWAGPRTAQGPMNCGNSARLSLPDNDLTTLAMAAGGFGISDKSIPLSAPAGVTYAAH